MGLQELIDDYYSSFDFNNLRDETKTQYRHFIDVMLKTEVEGKSLRQYSYKKFPTKVAKMAYNQWCNKGIHMANHVMSCTNVLFNHGLRMEMCSVNPFAKIRKRTPEKRKTVWTKEQVEQFLGAAYSDYKYRSIGLILHMAYEWGQRLGDMRMLTWDAIDFDKQTVYIKQSKRKAEVHLPIIDDLFDMLKQQREEFGFQPYVAPRPDPIKGAYRPYTLQKLPLHGRKLMDSIGFPKELRMSDMRRTATVQMVEAGVGMAQIMAVTGHANPASVKPYMKNTLKSASTALTARQKHDTSISSAAQESDIHE